MDSLSQFAPRQPIHKGLTTLGLPCLLQGHLTLNSASGIHPLVSVIILNYNGARWVERCLASLKGQSILKHIEVIVADNGSSDGSDELSEKLLSDFPAGRFIQNGANLGYCEGNNRPSRIASGEYLLFLNNDTWLEPDCLEKLVGEVRRIGADAATPLIRNYEDDSFQSLGAAGFDIFGLSSSRLPHADTREVLMPDGSAYLIRKELFNQLGGFDPEFFMYADEMDLSWRVWLSGHKAIAVPKASLHHRSAAAANPAGGGSIVELRTNATTRYYSNRNSLLVFLKNAQHMLLPLVGLQVALLALEGLVAIILTRNTTFVRRAYWDAVTDCWKLRRHILAQRRLIRGFRRRSDWWMLRFLRLRLNRWGEIQRIRRLGLPKVSAQ